jgi:hypothetical protein
MQKIFFRLAALSLAVILQAGFYSIGEASLNINDEHGKVELLSGAKDAPGISELEYQKRLERENKRHEMEMQRKDGESDEDWKLRRNAEKQRHEKITSDLKRTAKGKK